MAERFGGFPPEGIAFLAGLAADNTRAFFDAQRRAYERDLAGPIRQGEVVHQVTAVGHLETGTDRLESGETETADFGVIDADTQAWCTVPGHKEAGMLLDIVVTEPAPDTTTTTAPAGA